MQVYLPLLIVVLSMISYLFFTNRAIEVAETGISESANETLQVQTEAILTQLDKYRYLPSIIALEPDIAAALNGNMGFPGKADVLNNLRKIQGNSGALEISLARPDGTIALSTENFFVDARIEAGELLVAPYQGRLGRASVVGSNGIRAYAFSSRITDPRGYAGFVTVVAPIEGIEQSWALSGKPVFATNGMNQIVAKNFQAEEWVGPVLRERTVQSRVREPVLRTANNEAFKLFSSPITIIGWRLHVLERMEPVSAAARAAGTISLLGSALAGILALALFVRARQRMIRDRLDKANALRLERRVIERTRELVQANALLESEIVERQQAEMALLKAQKELIQAGKLAGLGQMSAALSHEFNQPLAAIKSYADNAGQYLAKQRLPEAIENIHHILSLTDRMAAISKHLRNFARRPKEKTIPVHLDEVIRDALEIISAKLKEKPASIEVNLPEKLPMVRAGHTRLQQVIVNLLSNALDAKEKRRPLKIRISALQNGDRITLFVRDNGTGFADSVLEQIFDPFFSTKDVNKGLGLGMSISYNIIKDFGGNIAVSNNPDHGACVAVELMLASEKQEASKPQSEKQETAAQ